MQAAGPYSSPGFLRGTDMSVLPVLAVSFVMKMVAVFFVICSVALVLVILIQKGRGGGLSGALGGGMASNILGSKTGDFLTWVTIVLVGLFLLLAVLMVRSYKPTVTGFDEETGRSGSAPQEQRQPSSTQPGPDQAGSDTGEASGTPDMNQPG